MEDPLADIPYISAPPTLQHSIIGPCVAGYQTQVLLCGILLQQVVAYWGELKHHSKLSKYTAVVVVTLNVVYTALCFEDGFTLASSTDRRTDTLYSGTFQSQFLPLCNGMIAAAAETFLTIRAGAFFMNQTAKYAFYIWQSCLVVLVLFGSCATFTVGMVAYFKPDQADVIPYNTVVAIWLWSSAASDCSISIALAYNLHKRIANFNQKTDSILRKLILIGLRTAAFTAILSLVGAVISSVYSGNDRSKVAITVPFWIPTGALYGISLFTTLSSTRRVVGTVRGGQDQPPSSSKPGRARSTSQSGGGMPRHLLNFNHHHPLAKGPLEINVHREVVRDVEIDCSIEKPETAFEASFETIGNRSSQWTSSAA